MLMCVTKGYVIMFPLLCQTPSSKYWICVNIHVILKIQNIKKKLFHFNQKKYNLICTNVKHVF